MHRKFTLLLVVSLTLCMIALQATPPVGAETDIETSAFISVQPEIASVRDAVQAEMRIEPAPPTSVDAFHITLKVTRPDGIVDVFDVLPIHGRYLWLYAPNQVGNFTFEVFFDGQSFANGVVYKPSSSSTVLVVPGTPRPETEADGGSWATKASMNETRGGIGVVALNGKIYAIGGATMGSRHSPNTDQLLTTNEEYDPVTDTWILKKPMPTKRANFAIAAVQGKVYCMGGIIGKEAYSTFPSSSNSQTGTNQPEYTLVNFEHYRYVLTNVTEAYDPITDTWETKAPMPEQDNWATANAANGRIYVLSGGKNYVYDPASDTWSTTESAPSVPSSVASAVIRNKIYHLNNGRPVFVYDSETDHWSEGAHLPEMEIAGPAGATAGVAARRRLYVFGVEPRVSGQNEARSADDRRVNFVYDPETDAWTAAARMPTSRFDFGIANVGDTLYVVGGYSRVSLGAGTQAFAVNEQYTPAEYGNVPPTVDAPSETETPTGHVASPETPITTLAAVASGASVGVITAGLLVYVKKRNHKLKT